MWFFHFSLINFGCKKQQKKLLILYLLACLSARLKGMRTRKSLKKAAAHLIGSLVEQKKDSERRFFFKHEHK